MHEKDGTMDRLGQLGILTWGGKVHTLWGKGPLLIREG